MGLGIGAGLRIDLLGPGGPRRRKDYVVGCSQRRSTRGFDHGALAKAGPWNPGRMLSMSSELLSQASVTTAVLVTQACV